MEYLQYNTRRRGYKSYYGRFKPCYKWNTFNTTRNYTEKLNVIFSFKPCYKWNTFNTVKDLRKAGEMAGVLNLVINGIPSILK